MRIIKFRAFILGKMYDVKAIDFDGGNGITITTDGGFYNISHGTKDEHGHLMQYTGLKDKNDVEIYEGDNIILHQFLFDGGEYENQLIGRVIYDNNQSCYCLTNIKNEQVQEYMGYKDDYTNFQKETVPINLFYGMHEESFEVIGNIHEGEKNE